MMALNDREELFAEEYIKLGNAYQAALNAGYAKSTAKDASKWINPEENLKKPNEKSKYKPEVREYINNRMKDRKSELIAEQDEVLQFLTAVLRGEEKDEQLVSNAMGEFELQEVRRQNNQMKAAELLAKRYGLLVEKLETDVDMELNIKIDYGCEE